MPIPGCPFGFGRLFALGGRPKEFGAACGPLLFQFGVGSQALLAFEQEPGMYVDGQTALVNLEQDFAVALGLAHEKGFLALLFFLLLDFSQAPPFLDALHLRGVVYRSFCHNILLSGGRHRLSGHEASGEKYFANGRKNFLVLIRISMCLARGARKGLRPVAGALLAEADLAGAIPRNASF
jgi:hypothetical protein